MLGIIRKEAENKTANIVILLYNSVMLLHLESFMRYGQFYSCHLQKDVNKAQEKQDKMMGRLEYHGFMKVLHGS